jgi:hypothetical protein
MTFSDYCRLTTPRTAEPACLFPGGIAALRAHFQEYIEVSIGAREPAREELS